MKKIISLVMSAVIIFSFGYGCSKGDKNKFSNRPKSVVITYSSSGFGMEWLTSLAEKYMTEYNSDTYVQIKKTVLAEEEKSKIQSGMSTSDIYMLDCHIEDAFSYCEELTDVYESNATGEDKKIIDKIDKTLYELYLNQDDKKAYTLPYINNLGYYYIYNETTLDSIFPNGYQLPRTTTEFVEFGEQVKNKDTYLLVTSFGDDTDNIRYNYQLWFAHLIGYEKYSKYFDGMYCDDASGEFKFNENEPQVISTYKEEIQEWWEILSSFSKKGSKYIHEDSDAMSYKDAEAVLCGLGFGKNERKAVFMVNGQWTLNEVDWMLAEQENVGNPQTLRVMKVPVASGIIKRTPSIHSEEDLRKVIDYIDGNATELPMGVTEADVDKVREARNMSSATLTGTSVIPKAAVNKEGAKDFLRFLASDEAQAFTAEQFNGIPLLPYGYVPTMESLTSSSSFVNDYVKLTKDRQFLSSNSQEHKFAWYENFYFIVDNENKVKEIFIAKEKDYKTAEAYYNSLYNYYNNRWTTLIQDYKTK